MIKLHKDGEFKMLDDSSSLIPVLKKSGWVIDGEEPSLDIDALKQEAEKLGIKFHHKSSAATIKKLIEEAK